MPSLLPLSCFFDAMMPFRLDAHVNLIITTMSPLFFVIVLMLCSRMLNPVKIPPKRIREGTLAEASFKKVSSLQKIFWNPATP